MVFILRTSNVFSSWFCGYNGLRLTNKSIRFFSNISTNNARLGEMIELPNDEWKAMTKFFRLPPNYCKFVNALDECKILSRKPAVGIISCLNNFHPNQPVMHFLLYGPAGHGKTFTLVHVTQFVKQEGWVILPIPWAGSLIDKIRDVVPSPFNEKLLDSPMRGLDLIELFVEANKQHMESLKTTKRYEWSSREHHDTGSTFQSLVEFARDRPKFSCSVLSTIMEELTTLASNGSIRLLVAVGGINGCWRRTSIKIFGSPTRPEAHQMTLVTSLKKVLAGNWTGGCIVSFVDNAINWPENLEVTGKKHPDTTKRYIGTETVDSFMPMSLLGREGFEFLDPFVPIYVDKFSMEEIVTMIRYYNEIKWIQSTGGISREGINELIMLSDRNPANLFSTVLSL